MYFVGVTYKSHEFMMSLSQVSIDQLYYNFLFNSTNVIIFHKTAVIKEIFRWIQNEKTREQHKTIFFFSSGSPVNENHSATDCGSSDSEQRQIFSSSLAKLFWNRKIFTFISEVTLLCQKWNRGNFWWRFYSFLWCRKNEILFYEEWKSDLRKILMTEYVLAVIIIQS